MSDKKRPKDKDINVPNKDVKHEQGGFLNAITKVLNSKDSSKKD